MNKLFYTFLLSVSLLATAQYGQVTSEDDIVLDDEHEVKEQKASSSVKKVSTEKSSGKIKEEQQQVQVFVFSAGEYFKSSEEINNLSKEAEKKVERTKIEYEKAEQDLQDWYKKAQEEERTASPQKKEQLNKELQEKFMNLNKSKEKLQEQSTEEYTKIQQKAYDSMNAAIEEFSKKFEKENPGKTCVVLSSDWYAPKGVLVTDQLAEIANKKYQSKKAAEAKRGSTKSMAVGSKDKSS